MGIENSNFFFIQSFFNKNYQFMPKIVVLEHWDHFFGFLGSFLIKILSFQWKKIGGWGFFIISILSTFFPFFLQQPPPLSKYFIFTANKLLPKGINLFLMLSRHMKPSNCVRIWMLCMQRGQIMNLFIGWRVFYGLDSMMKNVFILVFMA